MYSRKFSNADVQPPPDYGGVAYRQSRDGGMRVAPEREEHTVSAQAAEEYRDESAAAYRRSAETSEDGDRGEERAGAGGKSGEGEMQKGLLNSLSMLSGRRFSLEDVILAGVILLLIGEKNGQRPPDGQLLLILGLLLLSG
ncbi:MAG: hypothetical protein IJU52_09410 [Clostridia bacterium]|nr:hypothetical protein [Clostridia bacterium]